MKEEASSFLAFMRVFAIKTFCVDSPKISYDFFCQENAVLTFLKNKNWGNPGIGPGTSRTLSVNHTTRLIALLIINPCGSIVLQYIK